MLVSRVSTYVVILTMMDDNQVVTCMIVMFVLA